VFLSADIIQTVARVFEENFDAGIVTLFSFCVRGGSPAVGEGVLERMKAEGGRMK